jgi:hypothetical protein
VKSELKKARNAVDDVSRLHHHPDRDSRVKIRSRQQLATLRELLAAAEAVKDHPPPPAEQWSRLAEARVDFAKACAITPSCTDLERMMLAERSIGAIRRAQIRRDRVVDVASCSSTGTFVLPLDPGVRLSNSGGSDR